LLNKLGLGGPEFMICFFNFFRLGQFFSSCFFLFSLNQFLPLVPVNCNIFRLK
jgi:hypothetical protein